MSETLDPRQLLKETKFTEVEKSTIIQIGLGIPSTGENFYAAGDSEILDDMLLVLCLSGKIEVSDELLDKRRG